MDHFKLSYTKVVYMWRRNWITPMSAASFKLIIKLTLSWQSIGCSDKENAISAECDTADCLLITKHTENIVQQLQVSSAASTFHVKVLQEDTGHHIRTAGWPQSLPRCCRLVRDNQDAQGEWQCVLADSRWGEHWVATSDTLHTHASVGSSLSSNCQSAV